jgi:C-terminal peptidase prc
MHPALIGVVVAVLGGAGDWQGVEFGPAQFEQVVAQAAQKWLEPPAPDSDRERKTWRHAAEMALWSLTPTVELLPDAYLRHLATLSRDPWVPPQPATAFACDVRRSDAAAAGVSASAAAGSGLWLVRAEVSQRDPQALDAAWRQWATQHAFGRKQFRCTMDWIEADLRPGEGRREQVWMAWINAASGYLKGADRHGDVVAQRFWEQVSRSEQTAEQGDPGLAPEPCLAAPDTWCVADVRKDSPAWRADVRVHDALTQVAGQTTQGKSSKELGLLLWGPPGKAVAVSVVGVRNGKTRRLKLQREAAVTLDVEAERLAPGVVLVAVRDFVKGTAGRFQQAVARALVVKKVKQPEALQGLILDLRGNTGGLLAESIALADMLLSDGVVVREQWRGRAEEQRATVQPTDLQAPLVVLVDRRCGSACEVLAGALQDHRRGPLLGAKTYGKASMQEVKRPNLMAGYYVKVTIGKYQTPAGRDIDGVGLPPDVPLPAEATTSAAVAEGSVWLPTAACVQRSGRAPAAMTAEPAPKRRPDAWLLMAVDWLGCLGRP